MAIRFKRKTTDNWNIEEVNKNQLDKKVDGFIMYFSSHDITPINLNYSIIFLEKLLKAGNNVLIVSKPHLSVIESICTLFNSYKKNIISIYNRLK